MDGDSHHQINGTSRASGVDGKVSGQPDTCELGGDLIYAQNYWGSDQQRLDQFHGVALHLVVDINVSLGCGNALMTNQTR